MWLLPPAVIIYGDCGYKYDRNSLESCHRLGSTGASDHPDEAVQRVGGHSSGKSRLIPRRRVTVSDPLQLGDVRRVDRQRLGLAATHAGTSHAETEHWCSITGCSNSVQVFVPMTLGPAL